MPGKCPSCDQPVIRREGEAMSYCTNASCSAQLVRRIEHFVSRGAMDIEGLGIKQGEALIDVGLLEDVADIYTLSEHREKLIEMERMAEKSVSNLLAAIDKSRGQSLARVLVALGIPFVGGEVAAVLARHLGTMDAIRNASHDDLFAINTIGPKIADSVHDYFRQDSNAAVVDKLTACRCKHDRGSSPILRREASGRAAFRGNRETGKLLTHRVSGQNQRPGRRCLRIAEQADRFSRCRRRRRFQTVRRGEAGR